MFRESMLLNGILSNAEIWYPITDTQIEFLKNIDLMLIRKLIKGHAKAPKEAFFMETGLLPIQFVCMKRIMMYLHHILSKPKSELIRKVYEVQQQITTKNDWYSLVQDNKTELMINKSDEEISQISKDRFRSIVNKAVDKKAINYLNMIALGHSKSEDLVKDKLVREGYFEDQRFSKSEIELLFALRTRMVNDIKTNFSSQHNNNFTCDLCQVAIDCQEHLLSCVKLKQHVKVPREIEYSDLFRNTDKQLRIVKIFKQLLRAREILRSI
jgi:hypothetical protein